MAGQVAVIYPGPQGPPGGAAGANGQNGKTPYQSARDNGFVGTETEWLASLKGQVVYLPPDGVGAIHVTDISDDTPIYGGVHVTDL